jgi:hypothetical protein
MSREGRDCGCEGDGRGVAVGLRVGVCSNSVKVAVGVTDLMLTTFLSFR